MTVGSVISATLSQAEQDFAWAGSLEVTNPASFQRIQIGDNIELELGGEVFSLIIDNKTIERDGVGMPRLTVSVISPTARFTIPRATPLDKVWDAPVWAKDAAESAIGEAIQWDASMPNWLISGGRLAVHQASPMDIVKTIVSSVGGLVESLPDGTLRVRHRFPVAVPSWATAAVDHVLTDESDNLSCRESHILRTRVNKVLVRGYLPTGSGFLSAEIDARPDGLNHGRTQFYGGDTAHLLVHAGPDVVLTDQVASAGVMLPGGWQTISVTQDLVFNGVTTASLDKPAIGINSVIWFGRDMGDLTLESDNRTVSVSTAGVAICRVTYRSMARSWGLSAPTLVSGLNEFPVQVHFSGATGEVLGAGEIFCQRGDSAFRGEDISDPLLTTDEAKRSRGRAEIDASESLKEVSLTCLHRPGFMPGQLVEVHDTLMGQSWRGKITSVSHSALGNKLTTSLELLRHVQSIV
ncbi:MAG: hypothetical protein HQL95_05300 [Magnetococcales bacterium]|nr:hypothetical protein [Magnetococcales bacterium]